MRKKRNKSEALIHYDIVNKTSELVELSKNRTDLVGRIIPRTRGAVLEKTEKEGRKRGKKLA